MKEKREKRKEETWKREDTEETPARRQAGRNQGIGTKDGIPESEKQHQ